MSPLAHIVEPVDGVNGRGRHQSDDGQQAGLRVCRMSGDISRFSFRFHDNKTQLKYRRVADFCLLPRVAIGAIEYKRHED